MTNDIIKCPKCESSSFEEQDVDARSMYECKECGHIWYSFRATTNGPQVIIDEITDGVSEKGEFEIDASVLINVVFRSDTDKSQSSTALIDKWANKNKLHYEFINTMKDIKIKFWR